MKKQNASCVVEGTAARKYIEPNLSHGQHIIAFPGQVVPTASKKSKVLQHMHVAQAYQRVQQTQIIQDLRFGTAQGKSFGIFTKPQIVLASIIVATAASFVLFFS